MSELNTENVSVKKSVKWGKCKFFPKLKAFRVYLIALAVVFAVCCLYAVNQMTNSASVTITLNSASVAKGQNPDGTAFDIYQILSDEVLEVASLKLKGKISAAELKRHLSVADALSAQTNQQLSKVSSMERMRIPISLRYTASPMKPSPMRSARMGSSCRLGSIVRLSYFPARTGS